MGDRIRGTLGDIEAIRSPFREPQVAFRRVPFEGAPECYLGNLQARASRILSSCEPETLGFRA